MFKPFYMFVGRRYTGLKRKNHFISFISMTSMIGIALGVAVLITVLSVMNGFRIEIRKQMLSVTPHVTLRALDGSLTLWQKLYDKVDSHPDVAGCTPYVISHGMVSSNDAVQAAIVKGVDPERISNVFPIEKNVIDGDFEKIKTEKFSILVGREMAARLGVWIGEQVTIMLPQASVSPAGILPRMRRFKVVGIYDTGTNYDNRYVFIPINTASKLKSINGISGLQIKVKDELQAPIIATKLNELTEYNYIITSWVDDFSSFFKAIQMEKTVMWCILVLIIAVAAFNLVSTLVMVVTDKRSNIAILRTMGASKRDIVKIFIVQGAIVGIVGTLIGLITGLALAYKITDIVEVIQNIFNIQFMSEEVYLINFVPSVIVTSDIIAVCIMSLIMSLISTIYPSLRAAKIKPAEALRYE